MMNSIGIQKHLLFPQHVWAIVEQPAQEQFRLKYEPALELFTQTSQISLPYARHFKGIYGWIAGLGAPPNRHADIYVLTDEEFGAGDCIEASVCGMYRRADGDHKIIAVDETIAKTLCKMDLFHLPTALLSNVKGLYPQSGRHDRWCNADETLVYLEAFEG